jgi:hypothetical protein
MKKEEILVTIGFIAVTAFGVLYGCLVPMRGIESVIFISVMFLVALMDIIWATVYLFLLSNKAESKEKEQQAPLLFLINSRNIR